MYADKLREAAKVLREVAPPIGVCECGDDTDTWFSRAICPEPCGSMHTYCNGCARPVTPCAADLEGREPSAVDAAVADWLEHMAARAELKVERGGNPRAVWSNERHAVTVADAVLGGESE